MPENFSPEPKSPENNTEKEKWLKELLSKETRLHLSNYIKGYIKGTSAKDAEDIVQEVIIKANDAINNGGLRHGSDLKPWLFTIAHNNAVTLLQQRHRRSNTESLNEKFEESKFEPSYPGISDQDKTLLKKDLSIYLKKIKPEFREILMLVVEGFSNVEIAKILKLHYMTVGSRIFRARESLSKLMKEDDKK